MRIYKVVDIIEQDFGCEERPNNEEYCVDVVLCNIKTNQKITVSIPDKELYKNNINTDSLIRYENKKLIKYITKL